MDSEPVRLAVVSASGATARYVFRGDRVRMGRGEDNELHVPDSAMSRLHSELVRTRQGWELRDCGSTNGTRRNGRTIDDPILLAPGDEVGMGDTSVVFEPPAQGDLVLDRTRRHDGKVSAVDALVASLLDGRADFWESVAEPFLRRELSRDAARELVAATWRASDGSYKEMARLLRMPRDHKRLLNFLNRHGLSVDRSPAGAPFSPPRETARFPSRRKVP